MGPFCMGTGRTMGISKVREIAANEILQLLDGPVEEAAFLNRLSRDEINSEVLESRVAEWP